VVVCVVCCGLDEADAEGRVLWWCAWCAVGSMRLTLRAGCCGGVRGELMLVCGVHPVMMKKGPTGEAIDDSQQLLTTSVRCCCCAARDTWHLHLLKSRLWQP
jgi:hypothetical protein